MRQEPELSQICIPIFREFSLQFECSIQNCQIYLYYSHISANKIYRLQQERRKRGKSLSGFLLRFLGEKGWKRGKGKGKGKGKKNIMKRKKKTERKDGNLARSPAPHLFSPQGHYCSEVPKKRAKKKKEMKEKVNINKNGGNKKKNGLMN